MFPFEITDHVIKRQVAYTTTYDKGKKYFLHNRVTSFYFDEYELSIEAEVAGSEIYDVNIYFTEQGRLNSCHCNCIAFDSYPGICKHVVAVLKKAQQEYENSRQQSLLHMQSGAKGNRTAQEIINFFEYLHEDRQKEEVELEIGIELERIYAGALASVEMRIGTGRLYIIKNMKQFLDCVYHHEPLEFGKNFTYNPAVHVFNEADKAVLKLLLEIYEYESVLNNTYVSYSRDSVFKGKKAYLPSPTFKRFLDMMKGKAFNALVFGRLIRNVRIYEQDLPLEFELQQKNDNLLLELKDKEQLIPLTNDGSYFLYRDLIYHVSEKQSQYLYPFLYAFARNRGKEIAFVGQQKDRFVSELLPMVKKVSTVKVDKEVEENIYSEDLQVKIYFDKKGEGISAKIEFHYGQEMFNPFQSRQSLSQNKKILVRDVEKERNILALFEQADFKVNEGNVYLEDEKEIFEFIYDKLPLLQEQGEIFYSEDFKNIRIRNSKAYSAGVRLNEATDLLEFSFHYEDIPDEELERIFASIQQKKKYYRLHDGSFIPLDAPELEQVVQLAEALDIKAKDLKNKMIELPKYRAMYIDQKMRETEVVQVERNLAFKQLVQNISEPQDMEFAIPEELKNILRDYQKVGFKWLKTISAYGLGGILADDMGLGKTLQVIAFVLSEKEKNIGPSLVIAPTSLVYNWQEEVNKFVPDMKTLVVSGDKQEREQLLQEIQDADLVVTSYPLIRRDIDMYKDFGFGYCFLDEAQHIKNPNTISAKSVKQIKAKGYFALTGTPIENSLTELWSIFDFIMPGYLFSHARFVKKYESPVIKQKDEQALKELSRQIRPFVLRRMKKDVLKELPQKIESKMTAEMTPEQKKIYLAYLHEARGEVAKEISQKGFEKSQIKILSMLTRLRQICCHPGLFIENYQGDSGKMALLLEIMEDAIDGGHRILLFSQFTTMLGIIRRHLDKEKVEYFYLDGSTKAEERGKKVRAFNKGQGKVFLISLKAGGTGLNLTGADTVIHYDPWWNPAVEEQATDRAYRIGQKNVVQVMKLITQGTIEEKIYHLQQKKKEMIESVIQPGETLLSKMTPEEIQGLFEI